MANANIKMKVDLDEPSIRVDDVTITIPNKTKLKSVIELLVSLSEQLQQINGVDADAIRVDTKIFGQEDELNVAIFIQDQTSSSDGD